MDELIKKAEENPSDLTLKEIAVLGAYAGRLANELEGADKDLLLRISYRPIFGSHRPLRNLPRPRELNL
jgi:hypothetical protein